MLERTLIMRLLICFASSRCSSPRSGNTRWRCSDMRRRTRDFGVRLALGASAQRDSTGGRARSVHVCRPWPGHRLRAERRHRTAARELLARHPGRSRRPTPRCFCPARRSPRWRRHVARLARGAGERRRGAPPGIGLALRREQDARFARAGRAFASLRVHEVPGGFPDGVRSRGARGSLARFRHEVPRRVRRLVLHGSGVRATRVRVRLIAKRLSCSGTSRRNRTGNPVANSVKPGVPVLPVRGDNPMTCRLSQVIMK